MKSTTGVYVRGLDHIRGVAALLVFMWHFSHPPFGATPFGFMPHVFALSIFNEGHTGVALFMTLSGFIFSMLSYGKDIELTQFYKNRFLRVFPLLFVWCIYGVTIQGYSATTVARDLFTLLDYKIPAGGWTVIVEAQFYLLFPFVHASIEQRYRSRGLSGAMMFIASILALAWLLRTGTFLVTNSAQTIAYWTIFGRVDQFVLGAAFFYVYKSFVADWSTLRAGIAFTVTLLLLLLFWRWFNRMGGFMNYGGVPSSAPVWIAMPSIEGVFYGLLISLYLVLSRNFNGPLSRAWAHVGTISYSVYLANMFIIPLLIQLHTRMPFTHTQGFGEYFSWGIVIGFPLICMFSSLTYAVIERPFLDRRKQYIRDDEPTSRP